MVAVQEKNKVSPFLLFFLLHSSQVGFGLLNFQTKIAQAAGQDAWISVLAVGASISIVLAMGFSAIKTSSGGDLASFQLEAFGNFFGKLANTGLVFYLLLGGFLTIYNYIDVLQTFAFDRIPLWELSLGICIVVYYIVLGGFRIVTGLAFWGVLIPLLISLPFIMLFQYFQIRNIMPIFAHGFSDYLQSAKHSTIIFTGFECVFIYLPFIKNGNKSTKWAYLGLLMTTLLYFTITIVTFLYYTQGKLLHTQWPTLTMIKVISFSVVESFEFIFIFVFFIVIVSTVCIFVWSCTRTLKITFNFKPSRSLLGIMTAYFILNIGFEDILFGQNINKAGMYVIISFIYGYIPFIFLVSLIRKKLFKKGRSNQP
ncbi:GerAB/ArcD/ProY family transporter [Bacillus sp. FJAT-27245]|uniref:GerAB/ArcD/ProY family transporter n=1 Tax=Bacillus sp. FJAT-27245 TaxID=1684144 RepID=UPI0006A7776F|nr:GerAB/ArcD/ProY family transporter [Bacillus sp. FJAT-27245]